jgi:hypothetical protein
LSPACKEYETTMMGKRVEQMERVKFFAKFKQTCSMDVARFCSNADPKKRGAVKCINEHVNVISPACRETMKLIDVEE